MKVEKVPVNEAVGYILLHNQAGPDGRKALKKGQRLTQEDIFLLQELGREQVYVAILADDDGPHTPALAVEFISCGIRFQSVTPL